MRVNGNPYRTVWVAADGRSVEIIDQMLLPHRFVVVTFRTLDQAAHAINPCRCAAAAYGICLAVAADASDVALDRANVLTHCDAGWLAAVDWGTALAPIYKAHDSGLPVHVWVGGTRPRNQGMNLSAWELGQHSVKHTVIADNVGGHLMQHGMVDQAAFWTFALIRNWLPR